MDDDEKRTFHSGEAMKAEAGIPEEGNRYTRRTRIRQPMGKVLRQARRVNRMIRLKSEAHQIKEQYPDIRMDIVNQIKEWYPKTHEDVVVNFVEFFPTAFKELSRWKEIEIEMVKLFSRKGETNFTPKKIKREKK
ncbi:MAG: hypothetical protein ACUZ8I_04545 [Candidatus Scalindua sp.]